MTASLAMYNRPELNLAHQQFWALIRQALIERGISAPKTLSPRDDLMAVWTDPALVLAQTCGMPYRKFLHGKVNLVGTPHYGIVGCPPGFYNSVFVVRKEDPRASLMDFHTAIFAYNEENSQSGYAAPLNHATAQGVTFEQRVQSFGHALSAEMVASKQADIAALDAVTWGFITQFDALANDLRVQETTTPPTPALPFITSIHHDPDLIFSALTQALEQLDPIEKTALGLLDIINIPAADYLSVSDP